MDFTPHKPTPAQSDQIATIRALAEKFAFSIECTLPSRERSLALTKLEESVMWAVKAVF